MSKKYQTLKKQISNKLNSMAAYGEKKHAAKHAAGNDSHLHPMDKIYSHRLMIVYKKISCKFVKWAKKHGKCKTLADAQKYVAPYLQARIDAGKSTWKVRQEAAALAKLYQVPTTELGVTFPERHRGDVTLHSTACDSTISQKLILIKMKLKSVLESLERCVKMGRKYQNLTKQATDKLNSMAAYGEKKHAAKHAEGNDSHKPPMDKIYSYRTMIIYKKISCKFVAWAKGRGGCKTLADAQKYVAPYLQARIDAGKSAWTVRQEAAALAKLYQVPTTELGVTLPVRHRGDITLHSGTPKWQPAKHKDLVDLCQATGLRRSEIVALKPSDVKIDNHGQCIVHVHKGKGGRSRDVTALNMRPYEIAQAAAAAKQQKVIAHFPFNAQIHAMRSDFAQALYASIARPLEELSRQEKYFCRADMRGKVFDKEAMKEVSKQLGHGNPQKPRFDVVTFYLRER